MIARRVPLPKKRTTARTRRCSGCSARISSSVCPNCKTRKATKRTSIKARCDRMAAAIVKLRAGGKCEGCGIEGQPLDWAHGWARRHHSLRWETRAAFALCRPCHANYTTRPLQWAAYLEVKLGPDLAGEFERKANEPWDRDYGRVIAELTEALKNAKGRAA